MLKAFKFRVYPSLEQKKLIGKTFGCARFVYNNLLDINNKEYENGVNKGKFKLKEVSFLKKDFVWLKEVDTLALSNAKINLEKAFSNFFKSHSGKRKGDKMGFPSFKSKKTSKQTYTTNNIHSSKDSIRIENNKLRLPKIGLLEIKFHRELSEFCKIKSVTVSKNSRGAYYVSILTDEKENPSLIKKQIDINNAVGIDLSFHDFAVLSTGEKLNHPKYYRKSENKLKKLNRKLHKKQKGSKNRNKARINLAFQHEKVANQRKDFLHKESRKLVNTFDLIAVEDINLKNMSKTLNFGKSISDLGFGMFRTFLEYKAKLEGKHFIKIGRFFPSSQLCSGCGFQNKETKDMSIRNWVCPECGIEHDRDINAAINIRNEGINLVKKSTLGNKGSYAWGNNSATFSKLQKMQELLKNQEAPRL